MISVGLGKESDDDKLVKLQGKLEGAMRGVEMAQREHDKLVEEAPTLVSGERRRMNLQREEAVRLLSKRDLNRNDYARLNGWREQLEF